jgi:hypothetical protein
MGQGSLFGGWEATQLEISLGFVPGKGSGFYHVSTLGVNHETLTHKSVTWSKERDLTDAGEVAKGLVHWWLYGAPEHVTEALPNLINLHLPRIGAGDDRRA